MSVGMHNLLRMILRDGVFISLHSATPGPYGSAVLVRMQQPTGPGVFHIVRGTATNLDEVEFPASNEDGIAREIGIWLRDGSFFGSGRLIEEVAITSSHQVFVTAGGLVIEIRDG